MARKKENQSENQPQSEVTEPRKPFIGAWVQFTATPNCPQYMGGLEFDGKPHQFAALVTAIAADGSVYLNVYPPKHTMPSQVQNCTYDAAGDKGYTWHWPEE